MMPLLEIDRLTKTFPVGGDQEVHALRGVSLTLDAGETLGIVGESGCGKTTLARLILKLERATEGRIRFDGVDIVDLPERHMRTRRKDLQVVFQDPAASLNPRMRVSTLIAEPLQNFGVAADERDARVRNVLETVGLPLEIKDRYPHALSGGQKQRVGIARALVLEPKLLICDEAVSALDVSVQAQILNLLKRVQAELGLALLFISHNLAVVRHLCHRIAVMYLGEIVEMGTEHALFESPLHPYTRGLLASVLEPAVGSGPIGVSLSGEAPSPLAPPEGCAFRGRCSIARDACAESPELVEWRPGHWARCHFADAT